MMAKSSPPTSPMPAVRRPHAKCSSLPTAFETGEADQHGASSEDDEHRDNSFERPGHGVPSPDFGPNEKELSHGRVWWQTRGAYLAMGPLASSLG